MSKISIMIVDDSEIDRYLLKRFLHQTDLVDQIFEAVDGYEAYELLKAYKNNDKACPEGFPPVVLFLDVNMPRMNGFEFLEHYTQLMNEQQDLSICIMMFTSSGAQDDKTRAFSYSCVKDYIEKGDYTVESLTNTLLKYIE